MIGESEKDTVFMEQFCVNRTQICRVKWDVVIVNFLDEFGGKDHDGLSIWIKIEVESILFYFYCDDVYI